MEEWIAASACFVHQDKHINYGPPSIFVAGRACLLRFSTVMSLDVTAKAVTQKFVLAQWWKVLFCLFGHKFIIEEYFMDH